LYGHGFFNERNTHQRFKEKDMFFLEVFLMKERQLRQFYDKEIMR